MDKFRVRGRRQARGNTFIQFDQTYPIPEDCTTTGLQAMFEGGILYVTFHKKKVDDVKDSIVEDKDSPPPPPPPKPSPSIRPAEQQKDETPSNASTASGGGDGKPVEAPSSKVKSEMDEENERRQSISTTTEAKAPMEAAPTKLKSPEDEEETNLGKASAPKTTTEALSSGKAVLSNKQEAEKVSKVHREDDHIVEKATAGEEIAKMEKALALDQKQTEIGGKMSKESKSMDESSTATNASENPPDRKQTEGGSEKINKESNLTAENDTDQKRLKKEKIDEYENSLYQKGIKIGSTVINGYTYEKYKQIVKDFITPQDEEERKLLMNIGVAALVIVALGTYITYSRWSSSAKRQ